MCPVHPHMSAGRDFFDSLNVCRGFSASHARPSIQACSSLSGTPLSNRRPSSQAPPPACSARLSALEPMPLLPDAACPPHPASPPSRQAAITKPRMPLVLFMVVSPLIHSDIVSVYTLYHS